MEKFEELRYYTAGDIVTIKHNVPNKPIAWVIEKSSRNVRNPETNEYETVFLGIKCRWFDNNGDLQEATFNTKDLCLVEE